MGDAVPGVPGHTRMSRLPVVTVAHWVVMVSFPLLFLTLVTGYGQVVDPAFTLPLIGHFPPLEWVIEVVAVGVSLGIVVLMLIRAADPAAPAVTGARRSRFFGSNQCGRRSTSRAPSSASCCASARAARARVRAGTGPGTRGTSRSPRGSGRSSAGGRADDARERDRRRRDREDRRVDVVVRRHRRCSPTMGVAWHRFLAFVNIYASGATRGRTALGALQPMRSGGAADRPRRPGGPRRRRRASGSARSRTSPGRACSTSPPAPSAAAARSSARRGTPASRCPRSWSCSRCGTTRSRRRRTLAAGGRDEARRRKAAAEVGSLSADRPRASRLAAAASTCTARGGVIDPDVLWACTTCGACVRAVPGRHRARRRDRRHAPLPGAHRVGVPRGAGRHCSRNLEKKGNPWGHAAAQRGWPGPRTCRSTCRWSAVDVESATESSTCSGSAARARSRTGRRRPRRPSPSCCTRPAVELRGAGRRGDLHRRPGPAGGQRVPVPDARAAATSRPSTRLGAQRRSSSPARTASTPLANEYPQLGGRYEVVHHTQLLNRWSATSGRLDRSLTVHRTDDAQRHLPRPVLPRPAQQGLRPAAGADRRAPGRRVAEMPRNRRAVVLLRCRWCAHVDGGDDRHADQHRPHRRGPRHRRRRDRDRLPVLQGHAHRRPHRPHRPRGRRARTSRSSTSPRCSSPACDSRRPVLRSRSARSPERPR